MWRESRDRHLTKQVLSRGVEWAVNRIVRVILMPLTRPGGLETLRLIGGAGPEGMSRQAIEAGFALDQHAQITLLLRDLSRVRAVRSEPDSADGRRKRYCPTIHTPRMIAIGEGLSAWIEHSPLAPGAALSTRAAKLPLRLAATIWIEGLVPALRDRPLTVGELAADLGKTPTQVRHIADRATAQGLLQKHQCPGGQKCLSTTLFFSRLVPTVAKASLYLSRAFKCDPDCFTEVELRTAFIETLKAVTLRRPLDVSVGLRVIASAGSEVIVVGHFQQGVLTSVTRGGDYIATIESDLPGWLVFLADGDRSHLQWAGRGASSLLEAIEAL